MGPPAHRVEAETFRAYDLVEQPLDAAAAEALLQAQLRKALRRHWDRGRSYDPLRDDPRGRPSLCHAHGPLL